MKKVKIFDLEFENLTIASFIPLRGTILKSSLDAVGMYTPKQRNFVRGCFSIQDPPFFNSRLCLFEEELMADVGSCLFGFKVYLFHA